MGWKYNRNQNYWNCFKFFFLPIKDTFEYSDLVLKLNSQANFNAKCVIRLADKFDYHVDDLPLSTDKNINLFIHFFRVGPNIRQCQNIRPDKRQEKAGNPAISGIRQEKQIRPNHLFFKKREWRKNIMFRILKSRPTPEWRRSWSPRSRPSLPRHQTSK